jgi:hypothetical protein
VQWHSVGRGNSQLFHVHNPAGKAAGRLPLVGKIAHRTRAGSGIDRTFIPRWVLHRHAVEPMVHWL